MITKVSDSPCWAFPMNDEGDEIHFLTQLEATEFAARYGSRYGAPHQLPVPCWTATCDTKACEGVEGNEDGDAIHLPALAARHVDADLQDLVRVEHVGLQCLECREKAHPPADPTLPPQIVTYDDVARLIGVVAVLSDRIIPWRDPDTHAFVSRFSALTSRVSLGRGSWSMEVRPFAIQVPLPDMPTATATTSVIGVAR